MKDNRMSGGNANAFKHKSHPFVSLVLCGGLQENCGV
jgi:hypothetical protein